MNFEALSLIHDLLAKNKNDTGARLKELNKSMTVFQKDNPYARVDDFPQWEELKEARSEFDAATRALNDFNAVKWQGAC